VLAKLARRESAALLSKGRCASALISRDTHRSAPGSHNASGNGRLHAVLSTAACKKRCAAPRVLICANPHDRKRGGGGRNVPRLVVHCDQTVAVERVGRRASYLRYVGPPGQLEGALEDPLCFYLAVGLDGYGYKPGARGVRFEQVANRKDVALEPAHVSCRVAEAAVVRVDAPRQVALQNDGGGSWVMVCTQAGRQQQKRGWGSKKVAPCTVIKY
jgi:hypothetical protein